MLFPCPKHVGRWPNGQCVVNPIHETLGTGTSELHFQFELRELTTGAQRTLLNVTCRPSLTGTYNLLVVDKKHCRACRIEQLLDLRSLRLIRGPRKSTVAGFADAMRLV